LSHRIGIRSPVQDTIICPNKEHVPELQCKNFKATRLICISKKYLITSPRSPDPQSGQIESVTAKMHLHVDFLNRLFGLISQKNGGFFDLLNKKAGLKSLHVNAP
jgi:hypothetical protein